MKQLLYKVGCYFHPSYLFIFGYRYPINSMYQHRYPINSMYFNGMQGQNPTVARLCSPEVDPIVFPKKSCRSNGCRLEHLGHVFISGGRALCNCSGGRRFESRVRMGCFLVVEIEQVLVNEHMLSRNTRSIVLIWWYWHTAIKYNWYYIDICILLFYTVDDMHISLCLFYTSWNIPRT